MSQVRWNKDSILSFVDSHIISYPTPINVNYMWSFGSTAGICLVIQIITGIFCGKSKNSSVRKCKYGGFSFEQYKVGFL